jgi:hypothetical protein
MFMKILSCVGAFFLVFLIGAIAFEFAGMSTRMAGTLALIAAVVTWFVFPSKEEA